MDANHVNNNNADGHHPLDTAHSPLPVDRYWIQKLILKRQGIVDFSNFTDQDFERVKIYAGAPMVDQSDLPFRLQCRRYGTNLCFTPMIHAGMFQKNRSYRRRFGLSELSPKEDRPLIAQLCGGADPEIMWQCAKQIQDYCDGIDINCGCPQAIAKRGNYGAFLLEQEEMLLNLVKYLLPRLKVPLSVKVRLLPELDEEMRLQASLRLYTKLRDAGIHLLTIHGRTRLQKGHLMGSSDWNIIAKAVQLLGDSIPILANGSIASHIDVQTCLSVTGADGIMSSEALLEYPPLFAPLALDGTTSTTTIPCRRVPRLQLAREYLHLAKQYPPDKGGQASGFKCIRIHIHRFLHADLQKHTDIRHQVIVAQDVTDLEVALQTLAALHAKLGHDPQQEELSWYVRHREDDNNQNNNGDDDEEEEDEDNEQNKSPKVPKTTHVEVPKVPISPQDEEEEEENNMGGWLF